jgi:DNA polymerase III sliding clamp (beta) subunit (PCNA family)
MTDTATTTTTDTIADLEGLDAVHLLDAIRAVDVARSTDRVRPVLCSVLLDVTPDDGVRVVATDSYRLACATVPVVDIAPVQLVLPAEIVGPLVKALTPAKSRKSDGRGVHVTIARDGREIVATVTVNDSTVTARARDDELTFPSYRQLTPETTSEHGAYNPAYLGDLGTIAKAGAFAATVPVRTLSTSATRPSVWSIADERLEVTYLLMPVRVP